MKKLFTLILVVFMSGKAFAFPKIVTTIFPTYDFVREIMGRNFISSDVTLLLDNGIDIHSYQPTVDDIVKISTCDLFIYVGGESDEWVENTLKNVTNKNQLVINLLDVLGSNVKNEEIIEGMQHEHEHHEHESEKDEHVWLSLRNAEILCRFISDKISQLDPANKKIYSSNTEIFIKKLYQLDQEYKNLIANSKRKTILFGDRFPFRYLVDDYGLKYYAAFSGCSAESEASFQAIIFLAAKVDELNLPAILTIENPQHKIAQTIKNNTKSKNQSIIPMNSMQSITNRDIQNGISYLSIMRDNLNSLKIALY